MGSLKSTFCLALVIAAAIGLAFEVRAAASPAAPAVTHARPLFVPVRQVHARHVPSAKNYAGAVTTLSNSISGESVGTTFDPANQTYYLIGGEILDQMTSGGTVSQLTNFFSYGFPQSIIWDSNSGLLYVSIPSAYEILAVATSGAISVLAGGHQGTSDGTGPGAQFQAPSGLTLDDAHHLIYVVDNDRLRTVSEAGVVTTVGPTGVLVPSGCCGYSSDAYDGNDGDVAIADPSQAVVYLYEVALNKYRAIAGRCIPGQYPSPCAAIHQDGRGAGAFFGSLNSITFDPASDAFYVADGANYEVRKVDVQGDVTTLAGSGAPTAIDGLGLEASFAGPMCSMLRSDLHVLGVCDYGYFRLVTLGGPPAPPPANEISMQPTQTLLSSPSGITTTTDGSVWYAETAPSLIARLNAAGQTRAYALPAGYRGPYGVAADSLGDIWLVDWYGNNIFGQPTAAALARLAPSGAVAEVPLPNFCQTPAYSLAPDAAAHMWFLSPCPSSLGVADERRRLRLFATIGLDALTVGPDGTLWAAAYNEVVHYDPSGLTLATFTGVQADSGIAWGSDGNVWFLSNGNTTIGKLNPNTGSVTEYQLPGCNCNFGGRGLGNLVAGPDGALWFTEGYIFGSEWFYGGVGRVTTSGVFSEYRTYEPRSQPTGIAFSPAGTLWLADGGASKIGHLSTAH